MPLRVVAGPGAQGRPLKLVKSTQTGKIAAETASITVTLTTENNPLPSYSLHIEIVNLKLTRDTYNNTILILVRLRYHKRVYQRILLLFFAEKRVYAISALIANIARTKRRRTKSFGTQSSFTLWNKPRPSKFQLQRLRRSWDHPNPVTITRIFTPFSVAGSPGMARLDTSSQTLNSNHQPWNS